MKINIEVPNSILIDVKKEDIKNIARLAISTLGNTSIFYENIGYRITERSGKGRYIKVKVGDEVIYVVFSRNKNDGRNAFLLQYLKPVYIQYFFDKSPKKEKSRFILF